MILYFKYGLKLIRYKLFAKHKRGHGIHSPFVFNLVTEVFNKQGTDERLERLVRVYERYRKSDEILRFEEIGAGSVFGEQDGYSIGRMVRHSSVNKKYGALLLRLADYFKPMTILELGTSVGISTAFIASGNEKSTIKSIEGVKEKIVVAKNIAREAGLTNVEFIHGNFNDTLYPVIDSIDKLDFVFFDGNHTKDSTIKYFKLCLQKAHNETVFVFDDIHWSAGMEEAWEDICNHSSVKLSIDLFRMGLIFFKKELSYEKYVIKF